MSSESDFAYSLKYNTHFIVRNITGQPNSMLHLEGDNPSIPLPFRSPVFYLSPQKTIRIFHYPINAGGVRDLLQIPGVQEEDIRSSLLKGELRHKFLCGDIELVSSNIDLLQFSDRQRTFLQDFGFTEGVTIGYDELDGYVQGLIAAGGSGGDDSAADTDEHETLRQLIHFVDEGPGHGFAASAYKVSLPTGSPFPVSMTWYLDAAHTIKLVDKLVTYSVNKFPIVLEWRMYASDGVTIIHTVTDSITYSSAFESTRVRIIT
jgi:hypothetical protein